MVKNFFPEIILHNSISIDGSLTNFELNMGLHYQIAAQFQPDVHLIGSNTIKKGIEIYGDGIPQEELKDFNKQQRSKDLPYWVIIDSRGQLNGLLHICRRFEFCKDVLVLISQKTSSTYINYLRERNYDYFIVGKEKVNLKEAFDLLSNKFQVKTILTDTGSILGNILLNNDYVSKISLLIHPIIVGINSYHIFNDVNKILRLTLVKEETFENEFIWILYKIEKE
jgi:2,5-diamino-6-(ribosylamino)-4(3H)-pyrimidinone 5'-phosphate reductase